MYSLGCSLSHNNRRLKSWQGLNFAYIRASGSTRTFVQTGNGYDLAYDAHTSSAHANGILTGAYHFLVNPRNTYKDYSLKAQAKDFATCLSRTHHHMPPCIDIEDEGLTAAQVNQFITELAALGISEYITYSRDNILSPMYKGNIPSRLNYVYCARYPFDRASTFLDIKDPQYARFTTGGLSFPEGRTFWQFTDKAVNAGVNITLEIYKGTKHDMLTAFPTPKIWVKPSNPVISETPVKPVTPVAPPVEAPKPAPTPVATPKPTPTSPPPSPAPSPATPLRKLGAHVLTPVIDDILELSKNASVVKFVQNYEIAVRVKAINPAILTIGRVWADNVPIPNMGARAVDAAAEWVKQQQDIYRRYPSIDCWEGANERSFNNIEEAKWYADFELERTRLLAKLGLRSVVGNFSVGYPDVGAPYARTGSWAVWDAFSKILPEVISLGGYLGLHEYGVHTMWAHTFIPDKRAYEDFTLSLPVAEDTPAVGWATLRYRMVLNYLKSKGITPRIVITELGLDRIPNLALSGKAQGGWRATAPYWHELGIRDYEWEYARQLRWYEREITRDPEIIGATIFTCGATPDWATFDIANSRIIRLLKE